MTNRLPPTDKELSPSLPRSVAEAVDRLLLTLNAEDKAEIAGMAEGDLVGLHFGLGTRIRNEFRLWQKQSSPLFLDCQRIKFKDMANVPDSALAIHPDDASMVIIRALWARLRH